MKKGVKVWGLILVLVVVVSVFSGVVSAENVSKSLTKSVAGEEIFYPTADVSIYEIVPNLNNGDDPTIVVAAESVTYNNIDLLIRFDLSELSGVTVNWVELRLYCFDYSGSPFPEMYKVTSPWSESDVTWETRPNIDSSRDVGDDWVRSIGWFETYSEDFGTYDLARFVQE